MPFSLSTSQQCKMLDAWFPRVIAELALTLGVGCIPTASASHGSSWLGSDVPDSPSDGKRVCFLPVTILQVFKDVGDLGHLACGASNPNACREPPLLSCWRNVRCDLAHTHISILFTPVHYLYVYWVPPATQNLLASHHVQPSMCTQQAFSDVWVR